MIPRRDMLLEYSHLRLYGENCVEEITLSRTAFQGCAAGLSPDKKKWVTFRNISLEHCKHSACMLFGATLENVDVSNLTGGGRAPAFLWGCRFANVTLRGAISGLQFRWQIDIRDKLASEKFAEETNQYYRSVAVALDISAARFSTFEALTGVPHHLIKRNPETQFVLLRERIGAIKSATGRMSIWSVVAQRLDESPMPGVVVVLGCRGSKFETYLQEARDLRQKGILA
jgi:hypothetical protein